MKTLKFILIIISLITINYAANILDLEEITQQNNQWCWAGCSYTILTYYGDVVTQPIIVQYAYGDSSVNQWNWLYGHAAVEYNGKTYNPHGINEILDNWNTPNEYGYYTLSENEWKKEVDDGHPFVIRWGWTSGGGHFVVGQGYLDNGNYQIMDPWYGCGYTINTYNWMMSAKGQGNWTHSLTTDRSSLTTKYSLTVVNGTGSGDYEEGEIIAAVANAPQTGYAFKSWTGDISYIDNVNNSSISITMPSKDISITATYIDTVTPIDTTNPSKNLVIIAGWEASKDSYNSTISMDTSGINSDTLITADYSIATSDTTAEEWPWASIAGYTGNDFENVTAIKIVYKSSKPIKFVLEEPILSDSGYAFYKELPAESQFKTVYLRLSDFSQPDWTSDNLKQDSPNLSLINALSLTSDLYGQSTNIELKNIVLFNYKGDPVFTSNKVNVKNENKILLKHNDLYIDIVKEGVYNLSLYSISGKKLYERSLNSENYNNKISLKPFGNQTLIIKLKGNNLSLMKTINLMN